jgi:MraZ protein
MLTRKTRYGWLAAGGLFGLFALVLACKMRDGARAAAQSQAPPPSKAAEVPPPALEGLVPLEVPDNPLPPIDNKWPTPKDPLQIPPPVAHPPAAREPQLFGSPPSVAGGTVPATMPMPSPSPATEQPKPMQGPSLLMPANYSPDPMAGAAGTETSTVASPAPLATTWDKPGTPPPVESAETHPLPGEPPLAPSPGPVQTYQVHTPETMRDLARRTLGAAERWTDIHKLNPLLKPETTLAAGTVIRLPGDACVSADESEPVKALPAMHPRAGPARPKVVLPLTGTYPANLDDKKTMTLPAGIREQLGGADTLLVSPGPDQCLWLTNQVHLERLSQRLEQSPAREIDVRIFKRLYYAQTEKTVLGPEGRVSIPERLAQFAGLHQEVILVGIDDHFELWDAARWRQYTQQKSAGRSPAAEPE